MAPDMRRLQTPLALAACGRQDALPAMAADNTQQVPEDPFSLLGDSEWEVAARRKLAVFGHQVALVHLPNRGKRQGIPGPGKPPFRPCPMAKILAEECLWRGEGVTITANPFPFARRQLLLWAEEAIREVSFEMLALAFTLEEHCRGTVLLNSTGAAASISRAHLHLISDQGGFLSRIPSEVVQPRYLDADPDLECRILTDPFPGFVHALRGPATSRARAAHQLLTLRSTPAVNVISTMGQTFIVPRSTREIPLPYFPHALGSAELFGRWCFAEHEAFAKASSEDLEKALAVCCVARS